jgi:hippurate hydrolase
MRCLQTDVRIKVKDLINEFVNELPRVFGVRGEITYYPGYPVTMNHEQEALNVREAVSSIFGESSCIGRSIHQWRPKILHVC